jgi:hypothetical protein
MRTSRIVPLVAAAVSLVLSTASASGPVGIYGIVERVVFEPSEASPRRVQVWGAFAYADIRAAQGWASPAAQQRSASSVERGYLYFALPTLVGGQTTPADVELVKREWADLKAVAGTGQAIGFGRWAAGFNDLRIRPASESPTGPATYQTNAGIVKLSDDGSHAALIERLRSTLVSASR